MTGRGYMVWADGRRYDGEWLENRCNGRGVLTYKDGRRYEGEYKLDKMHGKGEDTSPSFSKHTAKQTRGACKAGH
eukprot:3304710-Rhodomonas_salina.1